MDRFLMNAGSGWCTVRLGDFSSRASYLTDVPLDCLEAAEHYLVSGEPIRLHFDAEGWDFDVISTNIQTIVRHSINIDSVEPVTVVIDGVTPYDLARQIYEDISIDPDGWLKFLCLNRYSNKEISGVRKHIHEALAFLKARLAIKEAPEI